MSIPTTELIIFDTSKAHRDNISAVVNQAFDIVFKADGCRRPGYSGVQIGNPATGYIFLNWDSLAHHQALINGPNYGSVIEALTPAIGGESKMHHVIFNDHPVAFEHPVTEVTVITLKDPSNRTEVYEILTTVSEKTEKRLVFGPTLEDENVIVVVGGWESIEAHSEFASVPKATALINRLLPLINNDHQFHTTLTPYEGKQ